MGQAETAPPLEKHARTSLPGLRGEVGGRPLLLTHLPDRQPARLGPSSHPGPLDPPGERVGWTRGTRPRLHSRPSARTCSGDPNTAPGPGRRRAARGKTGGLTFGPPRSSSWGGSEIRSWQPIERVTRRHEAALHRPATPESLSRCHGFACVSGRPKSEDGDSLSLEALVRAGSWGSACRRELSGRRVLIAASARLACSGSAGRALREPYECCAHMTHLAPGASAPSWNRAGWNRAGALLFASSRPSHLAAPCRSRLEAFVTPRGSRPWSLSQTARLRIRAPASGRVRRAACGMASPGAKPRETDPARTGLEACCGRKSGERGRGPSAAPRGILGLDPAPSPFRAPPDRGSRGPSHRDARSRNTPRSSLVNCPSSLLTSREELDRKGVTRATSARLPMCKALAAFHEPGRSDVPTAFLPL
jgi:hypothetical protein